MSPAKKANCSSDEKIVINVGTERFEVNREELCQKSKYFRALIQLEEAQSDSEHKIYQVTLTDIPVEAVKCLIDFVLYNELHLDAKNILNVYVWADFFSQDTLTDECRGFLLSKLDNPCNANAELLKVAVLIVCDLVDERLCDHVCMILAKRPEMHKNHIKEIGFDKFKRVVEKCQLIMKDSSLLYMGLPYYEQCQKFLVSVFPDREEDIKSALASQPCAFERQTNFIAPWALQESQRTFNQVSRPRSRRNVSNFRFSTCGTHDPSQWTISGMTIYFLKLYGPKYKGRGTRPIAGMDVRYRNIWTDEISESLCQLRNTGLRYASTSFDLERFETIRRVNLQADYRIETLEFLTSKGRSFGPFGRTRPGVATPWETIAPPQLLDRQARDEEASLFAPFVPSQLKRLLDSPEMTELDALPRPQYGTRQISLEMRARQEDGQLGEHVASLRLPMHFCPAHPSFSQNMTGLALHGISYHLCVHKRCVYWSDVRFIFCGIPDQDSRVHRGLSLEPLSLYI